MTRKQWVRQMPWQLAAAGAVAGALFGVSALYSASTAFADCGRGPDNCNQNAGRTNNVGNNSGSGNPFVQPQHQQQTSEFNGRGQNNNQGNNGQNNGGQNGQTFNLQQWQNGQQGNQHGNTQTPPTLNQNVQQFVQQLTDKWQQPQQQQTAPPQVTIPAYVPPVVVQQQPVVKPAVVQPPVVQQVVIPQIVVDPPAPVVNVQNNTKSRRSNNSAPVVNAPAVTNVVAANSFLGDPPKVNPAPVFVPNPVVQSFAPVQQAAVPAAVNQNSGGPNLFNNNNNVNNNDPWWNNNNWNNNDPSWDHHHHHPRPHDPPPPPPPPPVVYLPPVFQRTVVSCASVQPYYQQTAYPYGNAGVPYGYQGMPYGYNPSIFNQPLAPNYAVTYGYGQNSIYQGGYPYNNGGYPVGFDRTIFFNGYNNNVFYNNGYNNGYPASYNNGYPYGNQSSYDERVNTPGGILIIHHVLVACPQPVQQQVVYQAPAVVPSTPSYQQVSAAPQAVAPQAYAPIYQAQQGGYIAPPRTGDAGLLAQNKSSNAWLPDFVLVGLLSLFSVGVMARARQR